VDVINRMQPDAVFLTGDYVSYGPRSNDFALGAAWQCGKILKGLECKVRYAVLGNHDVIVGPEVVTAALEDNGIPVLRNKCVALERSVGDKGANERHGRIWLAGLDDPAAGDPNPTLAIPAAIRNIPNEPVVLLCHAPDYADELITTPAGGAVDLMLSGHTHGGQVRVPLIGALRMTLPEMGRKYVEGMFRLENMQLYVNRGIGTVGLPVRFNCPPEITLIRLRGDTA
jgi:predicted MPP superfamily phosphohydrolase